MDCPALNLLISNTTGFDTLRLVGGPGLVDIVKGTVCCPADCVRIKLIVYDVAPINDANVTVVEVALLTTVVDGVVAVPFNVHVYSGRVFCAVLYVIVIAFTVELLDIITGTVVTVKAEYVGPAPALFIGVMSNVWVVPDAKFVNKHPRPPIKEALF